MTPVYRAVVTLTPANSERSNSVIGFAATPLGGLASGLGIGPKDQETQEALAVLHSQEFTERFITDLHLMPKLFPTRWNSTTEAWWKAGFGGTPTLSKAYKYFDQKVRLVAQDKKTGLVTIEIDWTDRNDAAVWANELVRRLNDEMRARAIERADASRSFLDAELRTTSTVEARDAIGRLMEAQAKERMVAHVTRDYAFRVVDKAMAADRDDPIKPKKGFMVVAGAILGLLLGIATVLIRDARRARD
jgi:uncharacterized protein involved in exopolysaccharide biosynthesis